MGSAYVHRLLNLHRIFLPQEDSGAGSCNSVAEATKVLSLYIELFCKVLVHSSLTTHLDLLYMVEGECRRWKVR